MKVFTHGSEGKPPPASHTFLVCPPWPGGARLKRGAPKNEGVHARF